MCSLRNNKLQVFNNNTDYRIKIICTKLGYLDKKSIIGPLAAINFPLTVGKLIMIGGKYGI